MSSLAPVRVGTCLFNRHASYCCSVSYNQDRQVCTCQALQWMWLPCSSMARSRATQAHACICCQPMPPAPRYHPKSEYKCGQCKVVCWRLPPCYIQAKIMCGQYRCNCGCPAAGSPAQSRVWPWPCLRRQCPPPPAPQYHPESEHLVWRVQDCVFGAAPLLCAFKINSA
jgi:hypothetical protein